MMIVYRFNDKVTFCALVVIVILSFIVCIGIYGFEFYQTASFWEESAKCMVTQDFGCLLNIRADQSINKDLMLSILGACLAINGTLFGFIIVFLFKGFKSSSSSNITKKS